MTRHVFPPRRILAATDMSENSRPALDFARRLRERFGSAVTVVHAHYFELPPYFSAGRMATLARELDELKDQAAEHLRRVCTEVMGDIADARVVERSPVEAVLETSESIAADLIVMGTHGRRGAARIWPGSVAEQVLRQSRRPVLAVRPGVRIADIRSILCPVAATPSGAVALDYAAQLAAAFGATGLTGDLLMFFCLVVGPMWIFVGLLFVANAAFNNLGMPLLSTLFSWGRATLGTIPLAWLGAHYAGPKGALVGSALGAIVFGVLALVFAYRGITRLEQKANGG